MGIVIGGTEPVGARSESYLIAYGLWLGGALLGGIVGSFFPRTDEVVLAARPADERAGTERAGAPGRSAIASRLGMRR